MQQKSHKFSNFYYLCRMKRILMLLTAILVVASVEAQTIALGERTPRLKNVKWLNGNEPRKSDFTYIEFIHSASVPCRNSAERIYGIIKSFDNLFFVLVSHQDAAEIDEWVMHYIGERSGVIVNDSYVRISFGVNYAPYAVILDHKRKALWFGNPQLLDRTMIEKLITPIK